MKKLEINTEKLYNRIDERPKFGSNFDDWARVCDQLALKKDLVDLIYKEEWKAALLKEVE